MKNEQQNNQYKILPIHHILFWLGYFLFNTIRWGGFFNDVSYSLKTNLLEFSIHIAVCYSVIYYLIPKYLLTKKYIVFGGLFMIIIVIAYFIRTELTLFFLYDIAPESDQNFINTSYDPIHIISMVIGEIYVVAVASSIKTMIDWLNEKKRLEDLQAVQLKTELEFLKSQIKPHFFFNTLNSLYSLTLKKSNDAPDVVLKLSEIMEYVIYDANDQKVFLFKEINYIKNYVELEKIRRNEKIDFGIEAKESVKNIEIPPLLFLPFIENCLTDKIDLEDKITLLINFELIDNKLSFSLASNYSPNANKQSAIINKNLKRRLTLLYGDNFVFTTQIKKEIYIVTLIIPI